MPVIDQDSIVDNGSRNSSTTRDKSKVWINVGYDVPEDDADQDIAGKYISTPFGIGVDTQNHAKVPGGTGVNAKIKARQNKLLDTLKQLGNQLQPGEERVLNLTVKIRRVEEKVESETSGSDTEDLMAMLLGA